MHHPIKPLSLKNANHFPPQNKGIKLFRPFLGLSASNLMKFAQINGYGP